MQLSEQWLFLSGVLPRRTKRPAASPSPVTCLTGQQGAGASDLKKNPWKKDIHHCKIEEKCICSCNFRVIFAYLLFITIQFDNGSSFAISNDLLLSFKLIKLYFVVVRVQAHQVGDVGGAAGLLVGGEAVRSGVIVTCVQTSEINP